MNYSAKDKQRQNSTTTRASHKWLIGIAVTTILLAISVVTAVSMQSGKSQKAKVAERKPEMANQNRNYVTSNASGQTIVVNRQTGQWRPLTPEEAQLLAEGIKQLVNQSTEGLVQVHHANGSVSMDLQGRFQSVLLAKKEADGTVSQSCVDNVDAAAAFFEIDPELLGSASISKAPASLKPEDR